MLRTSCKRLRVRNKTNSIVYYMYQVLYGYSVLAMGDPHVTGALNRNGGIDEVGPIGKKANKILCVNLSFLSNLPLMLPLSVYRHPRSWFSVKELHLVPPQKKEYSQVKIY